MDNPCTTVLCASVKLEDLLQINLVAVTVSGKPAALATDTDKGWVGRVNMNGAGLRT